MTDLTNDVGLNDNGEMVTATDFAVCFTCGEAAEAVAMTSNSSPGMTEAGSFDAWIRETVIVVRYACDHHADDILNDLADEYGHSVNRISGDLLALAEHVSAVTSERVRAKE